MTIVLILNRIVFFLVFVVSIFSEARIMDSLNPLRTCVFSSIKARLTLNNEPVKNAVVIRRWEWKEPKEDRTTTDADGWFSFPAIFESSLSRLLPIELVIGQGLSTTLDSKEYTIWSFAKRNPEENSERLGKPIVMRCELSNESNARREAGAILSTMCTFD